MVNKLGKIFLKLLPYLIHSTLSTSGYYNNSELQSNNEKPWTRTSEQHTPFTKRDAEKTTLSRHINAFAYCTKNILIILYHCCTIAEERPYNTNESSTAQQYAIGTKLPSVCVFSLQHQVVDKSPAQLSAQ